jgi:putative MATE family efflux protein
MSTTSIAEHPPTAPDAPSLRADIVGAIRGTHRVDYTAGPIGRAIMLLAVPMVLEMAMESIFAVVDVFFVGRLGPSAVATVGLTESLLTILYALAMGLGIGATAMVARRIGERDPDGAARAAVQALALGVAIAITIGIAGAIHAPRLLALMGASPEVIATGTGYARVMIGGNATILLLFLGNAIFRGAGDAHVAMRVLWIANGINIVLDPLLIFGVGPFPALGVTGAAVATTIGRGTGVLIALTWLAGTNGRIALARRHLRIEPAIMARITRLSLSGTLQVFIGMASWIALVRVIASFGSEAVAGYTIAVRVVLFALLPSWGMSNAAATMVGQSLGARKPDRAERAVWRAAFYNVCFLGVVGILFVAAAGPIVGLFTSDPQVLAHGITGLRTIAYGFLFYAYGMVLTQSFNGAGDTWTPTLINFFVFWLWEIPLAILLALVFDLGPLGVFIAMTVAFSTLAVVSAALFRRGRWKLRVV